MTQAEELELASAVIEGIKLLVQTLADAKSGKLDPQEALTAINSFQTRRATTDETIDKAVDQKFGA